MFSVNCKHIGKEFRGRKEWIRQTDKEKERQSERKREKERDQERETEKETIM